MFILFFLLFVVLCPIGLLFLAGNGTISETDLIYGFMGFGVAVLLMAGFFIVRKIISMAFTALFILIGALLIVIGVFGKPLGLFDFIEDASVQIPESILPDTSAPDQDK